MDHGCALQWSMHRQRHYRNFTEGGSVAFVTTTILDFVPVFRVPQLANQMEALLYGVHRHYGAVLHAYVIMPEHVHWVCTLPSGHASAGPPVEAVLGGDASAGPPVEAAFLNVSQFVGRVKSYTAKALRPQLPPSYLKMFSDQSGLNRREFWQRSFRSFEVDRDDVFWQKVGYIHENPVRRGLAERPEEYRWSSASAFAEVRWREETGVQPWWSDGD